MSQKIWKMTIVEDPAGQGRSPGELPRKIGDQIDLQADPRKFLWFCKATPSEFLGTPKEKTETKSWRLQVNITASLVSTWNMHGKNSADDLAKVAFHIAKTEIEKQIESGNVSGEVTFEANTDNCPKQCPVDPACIQPPILGAVFEIEIKKKIGF